jgi:hypothetical protein
MTAATINFHDLNLDWLSFVKLVMSPSPMGRNLPRPRRSVRIAEHYRSDWRDNIDFACLTCSVRLDSTAFTLISTRSLDVFTLNPIVLGAGVHTLTLTGNVTAGPTASYSGTMNFDVAGVPEPATWAMMLVGFGGIGMALRRKRRNATALMQVA